MKLYFSWLQLEGDIYPNCSSEFVNVDGVSIICCLLMDDGGQRFLDTVSWLNEGIECINLVKGVNSEPVIWSRDAWGVELINSKAKIYSLYDESYFELFDIDSFKIALSEWIIFIQSKANLEGGKIIEF